MTPPKKRYDIAKPPDGLTQREFAIWRLGLLTMLLSAIEGEDIEAPPGIYMTAFENEYKHRKKEVASGKNEAETAGAIRARLGEPRPVGRRTRKP